MTRGKFEAGLLALAVMALAAACGANDATTPDGDICTFDFDCPAGFCCDSSICLPCPDGDIPGDDGDGSCVACVNNVECPAGALCEDGCCTGIETDGDIDVEGKEQDSYEEVPYDCPKIKIEPDKLDFGAVQIGNSVTQSFIIRNDSNDDVDLEIYDIAYNAVTGTAEFTIETELPTPEEKIVIPRGGSFGPIVVKYIPLDEGIDEESLSIVSNACEALFHLPMVSGYKGTATFCIEPSEHNFGNVELGSPAAQKEFCYWNCGKDDGNKILTVSQILMASGVNPNFKILDGNIDPLNPHQLVPLGETPAEQRKCEYSFTVEYVPQTLADFVNPHRETIKIVNNSDDPTQRVSDVYVEGRAESALLSVFPYPVDMGLQIIHDGTCNSDADCPQDQKCREMGFGEGRQCVAELTVAVYNWTGIPIKVEGLQLISEEDQNLCNEFRIFDDHGLANNTTCIDNSTCEEPLSCEEVLGAGVTACSILPGQGTPGLFTMTYNPKNVGLDKKCELRIQSTLPTAEFMEFPILGKGRLPNVCPEARAATQSHGPPIVQPIMGIPENTKLCFYGNISGDEDGEIVAFNWLDDLPDSKPEGSALDLRPLGQDWVNVCGTFDIYGDYHLQLKVQDNEGCWSEPFDIFVTINGDQGLQAILEFDGGDDSILGRNLVDMDLSITSPRGGKCSDNNINQNGTCLFPLGDGVAVMTQWSLGGDTGTTEDMRVSNPVDGPWTVCAEYVNDCETWMDIFVQPFCIGTLDTNRFTITLYDPNNWANSEPLFPTLSGSAKLNDRICWRVVRVDGVFQPPVKVTN
ncbi:MAG: hypothetical protein C4523_07320 [Myxococcales bacterium]|nr:MAG: hypothetical protein C4523_07320 [Myxococcales bacterium]